MTAVAAPGGCTSIQNTQPRTTSTSVPAYVTDAFAVLRTPREDADRPALPQDLIGDGAVVGAARRLGVDSDGKPYFLVPVVSHDRADLVPDDCLQQLSPEHRRAAERSNEEIRSAPATWKVCVFGPLGGGCDRARSVARRGSTGSVGTPSLGRDSTLRNEYGLVPDGVSRVRVSSRDGSARTYDVHRNFSIYRVDAGPGIGGSIGARTVTWLTSTGSTGSQPTP